MFKHPVLHWVVLSCLLAASQAHATIRIDPGIYEVPALIVLSKRGPEAVFNFRTLSEVRILLKGKPTTSLSSDKLSAHKIKFRVSKMIFGNSGAAELLKVSEVPESESVPTQVGNQLKPIARRQGY